MNAWDLADPAIQKAAGKKLVAIVPVGSLEQHGKHLPVSTDSEIVTHVAERVAKKCGFLLLPTISYGVSFEHAPLFNLSIKASTLQTLLLEICLSLGQNKIRRIIILNGHHGNQDALKGIEQKVRRISKGKVRVIPLSYWHFMEREFDHAGFVETSLMLAVSKKVKMSLAKKGFDASKLDARSRSRISKLAKAQFVKATKTGVWGDPTKATKKDGSKIMSEIVHNITKTVSKMTW
jgi:creatinine amidohydrolase